MASCSGPGATVDCQSGGKIFVRRRATARTTPYDRPPPPSSPSPNWLAGRIFPATKRLATGARKVLYSILADFSPSSSSSSDTSSGDEVDSQNYDDADGLDEDKATSSETIKSFEKKSQLWPGKSESKCMIETLLMQETFSWEECDRLIKIVQSRVVNSSQQVEMETPGRARDADLREAIMEAKRWLEERKVGSSSKSDLNYGTCGHNSVVQQHVKDGNANSPVDVAKLYMRARPPWASPSVKQLESRTPPPMVVELFGEERPYSIVGDSFPSSKKRDYVASGSWSIEEEIRKVRAKATDDMLHSLPSKIDLLPGKGIAGTGYKMHELDAVAVTHPVDALATGLDGRHGFSVSEKTRGRSRNEASSSTPDIFVSERNQDLEAQHILDGGCDASKSHQSTCPGDVQGQLMENEATSLTNMRNSNGFPPNLSLPAGLDTEIEPRHHDEGNPDKVNSGHDKPTIDVPVEANCVLLSEAFMEVPVADQTNSIASGSQESSRIRYEELSQKLPRLRSKSSAMETGSIVEKKQSARKSSRQYKRQGKGRSS